MTEKKIKIPLYHGELILIQTNNFKKIMKKYGLTDITDIGACAFPKPKKSGYTRYFIVVRKNVTPSIIAHEAVHIVNYLFNSRHVELDLVNDEPQAYLLGWVVKQCHMNFKIKKEK